MDVQIVDVDHADRQSLRPARGDQRLEAGDEVRMGNDQVLGRAVQVHDLLRGFELRRKQGLDRAHEIRGGLSRPGEGGGVGVSMLHDLDATQSHDPAVILAVNDRLARRQVCHGEGPPGGGEGQPSLPGLELAQVGHAETVKGDQFGFHTGVARQGDRQGVRPFAQQAGRKFENQDFFHQSIEDLVCKRNPIHTHLHVMIVPLRPVRYTPDAQFDGRGGTGDQPFHLERVVPGLWRGEDQHFLVVPGILPRRVIGEGFLVVHRQCMDVRGGRLDAPVRNLVPHGDARRGRLGDLQGVDIRVGVKCVEGFAVEFDVRARPEGASAFDVDRDGFALVGERHFRQGHAAQFEPGGFQLFVSHAVKAALRHFQREGSRIVGKRGEARSKRRLAGGIGLVAFLPNGAPVHLAVFLPASIGFAQEEGAVTVGAALHVNLIEEEDRRVGGRAVRIIQPFERVHFLRGDDLGIQLDQLPAFLGIQVESQVPAFRGRGPGEVHRSARALGFEIRESDRRGSAAAAIAVQGIILDLAHDRIAIAFPGDAIRLGIGGGSIVDAEADEVLIGGEDAASGEVNPCDFGFCSSGTATHRPVVGFIAVGAIIIVEVAVTVPVEPGVDYPRTGGVTGGGDVCGAGAGIPDGSPFHAVICGFVGIRIWCGGAVGGGGRNGRAEIRCPVQMERAAIIEQVRVWIIGGRGRGAVARGIRQVAEVAVQVGGGVVIRVIDRTAVRTLRLRGILLASGDGCDRADNAGGEVTLVGIRHVECGRPGAT